MRIAAPHAEVSLYRRSDFIGREAEILAKIILWIIHVGIENLCRNLVGIYAVDNAVVLLRVDDLDEEVLAVVELDALGFAGRFDVGIVAGADRADVSAFRMVGRNECGQAECVLGRAHIGLNL